MKTKQELYDYIACFNKNPGEYTDEEILKIGFAHKSLPNSEKNWNNLISKIGYPYSKETFRQWISRNSYLINSTTNNSEYEILYKEKTAIRDVFNEYRLNLRTEARIDSLKECIIKAAELQKDLPKVERIKLNRQSSEAILMFSDWHIGQDCSNFYNSYNKDIARERIGVIVSNAINYCKLHNVKTLNVLNLGDLIEGIINDNARITAQQDIAEEIMLAGEYMAEALNLLQEAAPVVTYRSCTDNHSRAISDKHKSVEKENFNRLIDWYLETRLKDTKIRFMKDNLDPAFGLFETDFGYKIGFMHGHEGAKNSVMQDMVGATHQWVDIVCQGHLHNPAEHVFQDMRLFVNGSLCGTGPFALKHKLFTSPSQKLIILDKESFINIDIQAE